MDELAKTQSHPCKPAFSMDGMANTQSHPCKPAFSMDETTISVARNGEDPISSMQPPPFPWTKPPSPLHGMAQVRKNAEDLHQGKLLTS